MNLLNLNHTHKKAGNSRVHIKRTPLLLVAFALFALGVNAQTTRYVDATGTDAGNCTDPLNPCASIEYAMDMAGSGDIIDIAAGVYTEQPRIEKDLTLQGAGSTQPGGTIIQAHASPGQATGRTVTVVGGVTVQISGVIIRHGANDDAGGGIRVAGGNSLTLIDATVTNNSALNFGGGLTNDGTSTTTLIDVEFNNNTAGTSGGGIINGNLATLIISESIFSGNTANTDGGALYSSGPVTLTDVYFTNNTAGDRGGAIRATGSSANITVSEGFFNDNTADGNGGAVSFTANSTGVFDLAIFTDNQTLNGFGGAFFMSESTVDFISTFFNTNSSPNEGGAIYSSESQTSFDHAEFIGNQAGIGGGLLVDTQSTTTLLDVLFEGNQATSAGGIAITGQSDATIHNTRFIDNEAVDFGGGFINEGATSTIVNSLFTGNIAGDAGGAIANAGNLDLINATITQNGDPTVGVAGGIYNLQGTTTMLNTIVWGNIGTIAGIGNATGAVVTGDYSLYDVSNSLNDGTLTCDDCLTIDPEFEDAAGGDFSLTATSPALDAGDPNTDFSVFPIDGSNFPIDLNGNMRLRNNAIDMGAYEFSTLSTHDLNNTAVQIALYPNPVNDILHIETEQDIESISIYTVAGQHIQTIENQNSIDLSSYTTGTYFVKTTTQNSSIVKQVIKK
ncbi:MAG: T9SS type A sorting domain-containing protein [Flavobacteriaceae bacterium]